MSLIGQANEEGVCPVWSGGEIIGGIRRITVSEGKGGPFFEAECYCTRTFARAFITAAASALEKHVALVHHQPAAREAQPAKHRVAMRDGPDGGLPSERREAQPDPRVEALREAVEAALDALHGEPTMAGTVWPQTGSITLTRAMRPVEAALDALAREAQPDPRVEALREIESGCWSPATVAAAALDATAPPPADVDDTECFCSYRPHHPDCPDAEGRTLAAPQPAGIDVERLALLEDVAAKAETVYRMRSRVSVEWFALRDALARLAPQPTADAE